MKSLQFAIASIVDANTNYQFGASSSSDPIGNYQASMLEGRKIRAKSLIAIFDSIRQRLGAAVARYRQRAEYRQQVNQLLNLSDRILSDIGLERGDLASLQAGLVTLEQLGGKRSTKHHLASQNIQPKVDKETQTRLAANQDRFAQVNCA
jgi:uncharacterized protein YjiS (DUF1127 family)